MICAHLMANFMHYIIDIKIVSLGDAISWRIRYSGRRFR